MSIVAYSDGEGVGNVSSLLRWGGGWGCGYSSLLR